VRLSLAGCAESITLRELCGSLGIDHRVLSDVEIETPCSREQFEIVDFFLRFIAIIPSRAAENIVHYGVCNLTSA
jgi:hypothetical protein